MNKIRTVFAIPSIEKELLYQPTHNKHIKHLKIIRINYPRHEVVGEAKGIVEMAKKLKNDI